MASAGSASQEAAIPSLEPAEASTAVDAVGDDARRSAPPAKRVLLISNRVMHYRVSVYNFFWRNFQRHGWEFHVLTNEVQRQNLLRCQFPIVEKPFNFRDYRAEVERIGPDAVILFLHMKDLIQWPLIHWLKWRKIPVAIWTKARNLDDPDNHIRNIFFDYLHAIGDGLILYSSSLGRYVAPRHGRKVFVANNTINFEDFPDIAESKEEIKRDLGIPFEKIVLFAGRIAEEGNRKKVDHLIDLFRELDRPDAGLVIVGSGLSDEFRARMNAANTLYLGEVHDSANRQISRIFKMADICSIPGHVGLGINQAFYWGLPMVTEDGGQPPEIEYLRDGENGFLVAAGDRAALKERILFLLDNDSERRRMSENARRDIRSHASIEGMFNGFLSCVRHISSQPPSHRRAGYRDRKSW